MSLATDYVKVCIEKREIMRLAARLTKYNRPHNFSIIPTATPGKSIIKYGEKEFMNDMTEDEINELINMLKSYLTEVIS
jgi:hypothetical protein